MTEVLGYLRDTRCGAPALAASCFQELETEVLGKLNQPAS